MTTLDEKTEVTGQAVIDRLRKAVTPVRGKKSTWLARLSDKQLAEVYHRLKLGQAPHHVCRVAQNEWGVMRASKTASLCRAMRPFRDKVLGKIESVGFKSQQQKELTKSLKRKAKNIADKIDHMKEMAELILLQRQRVDVLVSKELKAIPFKFTDKSVQVLGELLERYHKMGVELGTFDAKPSKFLLGIQHRFSGLLEHTVKGDGAAMVDAANLFLEMAEEHALTMSPDPKTGQFVLGTEEEQDGRNAADVAESATAEESG